ncbi:MBL fold metallo-hydrolase [Sphingobacterium griseoflavum]|uniref:DNA ligase-associated DEXH box helicase n=1 Tax=Sphingobacterium griseoflavum TaxID=1474952 RepID=A0ABQ3I1C8_9SPHI|nr:MBL fold metallo-hydrolase [Sphingobacterium griseoflavum]GHE48696.1 DNA ligase-associated DEXH box helicase [Sphingobacterium griseoflavum]
MILEDFLVKTDEGYYCRYGKFFIDARMPVACNLISHAHGDHATSGHQRIYATAATLAFMRHKFPKMRSDSTHIVALQEAFLIGDVEITFIAAGHMLGSAQVLMKYQGVAYLYTGDFKLQLDPTCEPLKIVPADVLITESTFANPAIQHPEAEKEILQLKNRSSNIMLGCYILGKAQRLTALINTYLPECEVLVHHKMYAVHRLYEEFGPARLTYKLYNRKAMKEGPANKIYLVPPLTFNSYFKAKNVLKAFASGWERLQRQNDIELYISDHVDWKDLLHFIDKVQPRQVWTVHGDGRLLQRHFAERLLVRDILTANG